jgi:competence ComEA-like helix-hairpin-helix protein
MEAAPPSLSIATTPPTPAAEWPQATRWTTSANDLSVHLPSGPASVWPRSAQVAAAFFLGLFLALLGWHAWSLQRGSCRPTHLEANALDTATVDLNQADHAQLLQLPGVGEGLAQRIEAYRAEHDGFRDVDELRHVRGIGGALLEKLRPFVYVEPVAPDEANEAKVSPPSKARAVADEDASPPRVSKVKAPPAKRIDLNRATAAELRTLPGIGPTLSERIIASRAKQPFRSVEDLRRVPGIGPQKLKALRPYVGIISSAEEESPLSTSPRK